MSVSPVTNTVLKDPCEECALDEVCCTWGGKRRCWFCINIYESARKRSETIRESKT